MEIVFGGDHLGNGLKVCGVYRIDFDGKWFYIGSSVDVFNRISSWKHYLSRRHYPKNRSIQYILPDVIRVDFSIVEIVDKSVLRKRESYHISQSFNDEFCLNLVQDAEKNKGRKRPLGVTFKEKILKGPVQEKKPVAVFDVFGELIKKCESIADASRFTGVTENVIRKFISGKRVIPGRYVFKGIKNGEVIHDVVYGTAFTPENIKFIVSNYNAMGAAKLEKITGIRKDRINHLIRGRTSKIKAILPKGDIAQPKKVIKTDMDGNFIAEYNSIGEAARSIQSRVSSVQDVLNKRGRKSHKGFKFVFG